MDNKIILAIAAVVVVIAAAGVGFAMTNGGGDDDTTDTNSMYLTENSGKAKVSSINTKLLMFGNANNDVYLNNDDVKMIQDIVDNKASWDKAKNPLADTNADGAITSDDVELLKTIIAGDKCSAFYLNSYLDTVKISFPLDGKVAIGGANDAEMLQMFGMESKICAYADGANAGLNITGMDQWKNIGTYPYNYEKLVAAGVTITLGQPYMYDDTFTNQVKGGMSSFPIDIVRLHEARLLNDIEGVACTVTLGTLMNSKSTTFSNYLVYANNVDATVKNATKNIADADKLSYSLLVTHACKSPSDLGIDTFCNGENYADVGTVNNLNMVASYPVGTEGYITGLSIENILAHNPDVVFIEAVGVSTPEEFHAKVAEVAGWFKDAGYTGKIIGTTYSVMGNASSISLLPLLVSYLYGESAYSEATAWQDLANYYNNFLGQSFTAETVKDSMYAAYVVE